MAVERFGMKSTALVIVMSLGLGGCQTTGGGGPVSKADNAPLSAEEQLKRDDDLFNETVGGGAVVGALVGGLLGVALGAATGDSKNIARFAIAGAAAGGIAGGVDGYMTAKAQESSNNQVRMLESMNADVQKDNERLRQYLKSSNLILTDSKTRLDKIKSDVLAKKITLAQANAERSNIEKSRDLMAARLKDLTGKRNTYRDASIEMRGKGGDTKALDQQISELERQVNTLEGHVATMNTALEVSRVG